MLPAPSDGFAATAPAWRARKSTLQPGTFRGAPAIAKRLVRDTPVWRWYFARELAVYRAFAETPLLGHAPQLYAADATTLVISRAPGTPIATRRSPQAEPSPELLAAIHAALAAAAAWRGAIAAPPAPPDVRRQLRARVLEDPDDPAWVVEGARRCVRLGILPATVADALAAPAPAPPRFAHGDALLRNMVADGDAVVLVDWECAGRHPADWDRALLWSQLGPVSRAQLAAGATPRFHALCAFALAREVCFLRAFRVRDDHHELVRHRADVDALAALVGGARP